LQQMALHYLREIGLSDAEMVGLYQNSILRDHIAQQMLADAARFRAGRRAVEAAAAKPKPVPQVQRPGVAQERPSSERRERAQVLEELKNAEICFGRKLDDLVIEWGYMDAR